MAGDGSFRARLSEAYRHPQYGLRRVPSIFLPPDLQKEFTALLENIDKNENSRVLNEVKMALMDEVFFFYKKVCDRIFTMLLEEKLSAKPVETQPLVEQHDMVTSVPKAAESKKPQRGRSTKKRKG